MIGPQAAGSDPGRDPRDPSGPFHSPLERAGGLHLPQGVPPRQQSIEHHTRELLSFLGGPDLTAKQQSTVERGVRRLVDSQLSATGWESLYLLLVDLPKVNPTTTGQLIAGLTRLSKTSPTPEQYRLICDIVALKRRFDSESTPTPPSTSPGREVQNGRSITDFLEGYAQLQRLNLSREKLEGAHAILRDSVGRGSSPADVVRGIVSLAHAAAELPDLVFKQMLALSYQRGTLRELGSRGKASVRELSRLGAEVITNYFPLISPEGVQLLRERLTDRSATGPVADQLVAAMQIGATLTLVCTDQSSAQRLADEARLVQLFKAQPSLAPGITKLLQPEIQRYAERGWPKAELYSFVGSIQHLGALNRLAVLRPVLEIHGAPLHLLPLPFLERDFEPEFVKQCATFLGKVNPLYLSKGWPTAELGSALAPAIAGPQGAASLRLLLEIIPKYVERGWRVEGVIASIVGSVTDLPSDLRWRELAGHAELLGLPWEIVPSKFTERVITPEGLKFYLEGVGELVKVIPPGFLLNQRSTQLYNLITGLSSEWHETAGRERVAVEFLRILSDADRLGGFEGLDSGKIFWALRDLELMMVALGPEKFLSGRYRSALREAFRLNLEVRRQGVQSDDYYYNYGAGRDANERIVSLFRFAVGQGQSDYLANRIRDALAHGTVTPDNQSHYLRDLHARTAMIALMRNLDPHLRTDAANALSAAYKADAPPYRLDSTEAQQLVNEVFQVMRRAYDGYFGFSAPMFEMRRPPGQDHPLMVRFGKDVASSVQYLNCSDNDEFPGRGIVISGAQPDRLFVSDRNNPEDPFHRYKKAWPWARTAINDLASTRFVFARGFIAVMGPDDRRFALDGKHYSYIFFNDHFHNPDGQAAFLIPTELLREKLSGVGISWEDYTGYDRALPDINTRGLLPSDLLKEAAARRMNILNLGWPSNVGGLYHAYPPRSSPHFEWEAGNSGTQDLATHVHGSYVLGRGYQSTMTPELDKALQPLRLLHSQVYELSTDYQNLLDLLRTGQTLWHRGQTISRTDDGAEQDTELEREEPESEDEPPSEEDSGEERVSVNPDAARMLIEAYRWHRGREEWPDSPERFPILVGADPLHWHAKPRSPFLLDTYTMTLTLRDPESGAVRATINLPTEGDGLGEEEFAIWAEHVMPLFRQPIDIRFYDRRLL